MSYDKNELLTIGDRWNTESLLDWSAQIAQAARQDLARLKGRSITDKTLAAIEAGRADVTRLNLSQEREKKDVSTLTVARRKAIEAAFDWREEVKGLAIAVFDSEPDALDRFHTGVKVSRSLPKLATEIGLLIGAVREHMAALKGVGADDKLVQRGEAALKGVEQAQHSQHEERAQTSPATAQLYEAQGVLYTRTRFVVRIAKVEFRNEPGLLSRYSYAALRRQESSAEGRSAKTARPAAATPPRA